jgi:hypothetical protein
MKVLVRGSQALQTSIPDERSGLLILVLGSSSKLSCVSNPLSHGMRQTVLGFLDWLIAQVRRPAHPSRSVPAAVSALSQLLRERPLRIAFLRAGGVPLLAPLLRTPTGTPASNQLLYCAGLCVWQLSYYPPAAELISQSGAAMGRACYSSLPYVDDLYNLFLFHQGTVTQIFSAAARCCTSIAA